MIRDEEWDVDVMTCILRANAGAAVKTYGQSLNVTSITKLNFISSYEFSKKKV